MKLEAFVEQQFHIFEKARLHKGAESIHEIRLVIKRLRALTKLNDVKTRRLEIFLKKGLKSINQPLGIFRDEQVYSSWKKSHPKIRKKLGLSVSAPRFSRAKETAVSSEIALLHPSLKLFAKALDGSPVQKFRALRKNFKKFKRAKVCAQKTDDIEKFHDWRKRTKNLFYELEAMMPSPSVSMEKNLSKLSKLGDRLGDLQDLTLIRKLALKEIDRTHAAHPEKMITQKKIATEKAPIAYGQ